MGKCETLRRVRSRILEKCGGYIGCAVESWGNAAFRGKREVESYRRILDEIGLAGDEVLFLSDIVPELDAARDAGFHTVLLEREHANAERNGHVAVNDFTSISLPS